MSWRIVSCLLLTVAFALSCKPSPNGNPRRAGNANNAPELIATVPPSFVEHRAGDTGITIRTPKEWLPAAPTTSNIKLKLLADLGRSVNLGVVPQEPSQTHELTRDLAPQGLAQQYAGFKLHKADIVKLGGQPAVRLDYEAVFNGRKLRFTQLNILKNGQQHILTYTASLEHFDALLPTFEQAAVSIRIP